MDTRKIDLHVHSTESDGTFTPSELVAEAVKVGISAFALTDHDTIDGISQAKKAAAGTDIELISGVELSTQYNGKEVHILGLMLDETNPALLEHLSRFRLSRDTRNEKMFEKLREEGFDITQESLRAMFPEGVLTRAHIARYLLENGYIKSMNIAFEKYIGDNCRCYIKRNKITPGEAISILHTAGGLAILAHPVLYHMSAVTLRRLIEDCREAGLDGIEAVYSTYQSGDEHQIKALAKEYGLAISGGSDFHGSNKPLIHLGTGMGHLFVPYYILDDLKECLNAYN